MEQQRALNALEPFLALSKSANSPRAAADLIVQATSASNTYIFGELLQTPNIQALRQSPEYSNHLTLLEIFAWGTWADYIASPSLPKLSPQQEQKLKLLSLLPLASTPFHLTYSHLLTSLQLPTPRALEELLTTAIYNNLLSGSLNPFHNTITISSVAPLRDIAPGSIPAQIAALSSWSARCDTTLLELDAQIAAVKAEAKERSLRKHRLTSAAEESVEKTPGSGKKGGLNARSQAWGTHDNNDEMDIDESLGGTGGVGKALRNAKRTFGARR